MTSEKGSIILSFTENSNGGSSHDTTEDGPAQHIDRPIGALHPYARNARTHSKRPLRQIAASIERFGFVNPVLVTGAGDIVAGHGRVEAARLLGLKSVPTLSVDHLNDVERRAYILAYNKLALNAGWDKEILAIELQGLIDLEFECDERADLVFTDPPYNVKIDGHVCGKGNVRHREFEDVRKTTQTSTKRWARPRTGPVPSRSPVNKARPELRAERNCTMRSMAAGPGAL